MFKFIFDLATEPLGLPIEWYYEWLILGVIGFIAYLFAYDKVGDMYFRTIVGFFFALVNKSCVLYWIMGSYIWGDLDWKICNCE